MANLVRNWKRFMATGCLHSTYACEEYKRNVREFRARWKPDTYIELGDVIDFTAIRSGAKGTKDECAPIDTDLQGGLDWLREMRPDVYCLGNHCVRPYELLNHPNSVLSTLASYVVRDIEAVTNEIGCKVIPYDIETGWYPLNDQTLVGHGYMYNVNALRDHVEMTGRNVIMAHLHTPEYFPGRTLRNPWGVCVGTGADPRKMHYARRRRQTLTWAHGIAYGDYCDDDTVVQLIRWDCAHGGVEECRFLV